ncbi:MAG: polymer-forming cytoskeletal protein [Arenimonas sp.]|nr:polymer-forming cytoskeletal protein [Arenimonas sp.]
MLGSKKNKLSANGTDRIETLIGPQVVIRGDLQFSGGLYIEGKVYGKVIAGEGADSLLTLAPGGLIEGAIQTPKAVISGQLLGDLYSSERVELTETARIQGNVHYRLLEITAGAAVSGQLIHDQAV